MASAKSLSRAGIFWNDLRRNRPVIALYSLFFIVFMPLLLLILMNTGGGYMRTLDQKIDLVETVLGNLAFGPGALMSAAMSFTVAYICFSHLYTMRGAQFYLALPVTRGRLYMEKMAAGMCMLMLPALLSAVITVPVLAATECLTLETLGYLCAFVGKALFVHLLFLSLSACCALMAGNTMASLCFFIVANLVVPFLIMFTGALMEGSVYGLTLMTSRGVTRFSPIIYIVSRTLTPMYGGEEIVAMCLYGVLTLALLALGWMLYKRRRAEAAGDVVAILPLKPVFKYGVTVCLALLATVAFNEIISRSAGFFSFGWSLLFMVAFGAIGYTVAEMLNRRSIRLPLKSFRGLAVYCGAAALALVLLFFMPFGFVSYQPDISQIENVQVDSRLTSTENIYVVYNVDGVETTVLGSTMVTPEGKAAALALHRYVIENPDKVRYRENSGPDYSMSDDLRISYKLNNGKVVQRAYSLFIDEPGYLDAMEGLLNCPEMLDKRYQFPAGLDVSILSCDVSTDAKSMLTLPSVAQSITVETAEDGEELTLALPAAEPESTSAGNIVLGTLEARRLYDAVMSDINAGRLGRFDPSNRDEARLTLSFSAAIAPSADASDVERGYFQNYNYAAYRVYVGADATDTNAVLDELLNVTTQPPLDGRGYDKFAWVYEYNNQGISYRNNKDY